MISISFDFKLREYKNTAQPPIRINSYSFFNSCKKTKLFGWLSRGKLHYRELFFFKAFKNLWHTNLQIPKIAKNLRFGSNRPKSFQPGVAFQHKQIGLSCPLGKSFFDFRQNRRVGININLVVIRRRVVIFLRVGAVKRRKSPRRASFPQFLWRLPNRGTIDYTLFHFSLRRPNI